MSEATQKITNIKFLRISALVAVMLVSFFVFTGCLADESDVLANKNEIQYVCTYNDTNDTTTIVFQMPFENKAALNVKTLAINFNMYNEGAYLRVTGNLTYDFEINHGQTKTLNGRFYAYGRVDEIRFVSFDVEQDSLWKSYSAYWIATICGAALLVIIAAIIIFVNDVGIDEFFEWIGEHFWFLLIFVPAMIPYIITGFWVGGLIILGGAVTAFLLIMLTFLVKFIIEEASFARYGSYIPQDIDSAGDGYGEYTVAELKELCRDNDIKNYSNLNKSELIKLLEERDNTVTLTDDDGQDKEYVIILTDKIKGIEYTALRSKGERFQSIDDLVDNYIIMKKIVDKDGDEVLIGFDDDDEEYKLVGEILDIKIRAEYADEYEKMNITPKEQNSSEKSQTNKTLQSLFIPTIKLTDIAGLDEAKKALEERVILPLKRPELYVKYGKQVGGGILLFGLPGTGKTMFAQAVATELDAKFFSVKCSDIQSKWYGEAENNVKELFTNARKEKRAVIFFDEFDSLGKRRTENNEEQTTVQEILTQMQGVERSSNMLLVIAATNTPWTLDGALLRPGRFNEKIYIPLPDTKARLFILKKELKNCPFMSDISLEEIAENLNGYSGADISELCEKVKMKLIREEIENVGKPEIDKGEINEILSKTKTSILQRDIDKMNEFLGDKL